MRRTIRIPRLLAVVVAVIALAALALVPATVGAQEDLPPLDISLSPSEGLIGETVSVKVEGATCATDTVGSMQVTAGQPQVNVLYEIPFPNDANNTNFVVQSVDDDVDDGGVPTSVVVECTDADGKARSGSAPFSYGMKVNGFTVVKDVAGGTSAQAFHFTIQNPSGGSPGPTEFTASDGGTQLREHGFAQIEEGRYTITETPIKGWQLTEIVCDDGTAVGDLRTGSVTFELGDNNWVTCTFVNTQVTVHPPKAPPPPTQTQPAYTG